MDPTTNRYTPSQDLGGVKQPSFAAQKKSCSTAKVIFGVGIALTVVAVVAAVAITILGAMGLLPPPVAIAAYTLVAMAGIAGIAMIIAGSIALRK
jgi:hypothetical protein